MKNLILSVCSIVNFLFALNGQEIDYQSKYLYESEIEDLIKKDGQTAAFYLSSIGNYKKALEVWDSTVGKRSYPDFINLKIDSLLNKFKIVNAVNFIVNKSTQTNFTILNEAHHQPLHRKFAKQLLQKLYDNGYRNLAVEGLSYKKEYRDSLLNKRKYPIIKSGGYIRDPQYGDFIREALEIGYWVYPYDDTSDHKNREINQAKHIIDGKKDGKTFIYVGFDHALEGTHQFWGKAMAAQLKILSKDDPLTINQINLTEKSAESYNHPLYNQLKNLKNSSVLSDKTNTSFKIMQGAEGYYDVAVIHPRTMYINKRPDWVFDHNKKPVKMDISTIAIQMPCQVLAFKSDEDYQSAVPVDVLEINNPEDPFYLALSKGTFTILFIDKNNKIIKISKVVK